MSSYNKQFEYNLSNEKTSVRRLVKRRFREFVTLHKYLEENVALRPLVKHVRGPSGFSLPVGNMDDDCVEKRRVKLSKYLNVRDCVTKKKQMYLKDNSNDIFKKNEIKELITIAEICKSRELITFLRLDDLSICFFDFDKDRNSIANKSCVSNNATSNQATTSLSASLMSASTSTLNTKVSAFLSVMLLYFILTRQVCVCVE